MASHGEPNGVIQGATSEYGHKYGGSAGGPSDPARGISWHFATKIHRPKSNFVARHEIRVGRSGDFGGSEARPLPAWIAAAGQIRV